MIAILVLVVAAIVTAFVLFRPRKPTSLARAKVKRQIARVKKDISKLAFGPVNFIERQEAKVRNEWVENQLETMPIEELKVPGTGPATTDALRENGISTAGELVRLRDPNLKIPNIGPKKTADLLGAYKSTIKRLTEKASKLDHDALNSITQGKFGATLAQHAADNLARARELEALEIRLAEFEDRSQRIE